MAAKLLILNGPNLNRLGLREPEIYGATTLADIERRTAARAAALDLEVDFRQSNSEGALVDWIQQADGFAGIIINAGGYTHTSVAILDALRGADRPVIEVHLSNIFRREAYRHSSFIAEVAVGIICGFGARGYELAVEAMAELIDGAGRRAPA
ncbi:MAG: type II 3-dehydroquinate dehydratase [Alphaproteobacteria bacterium]|nr:type II 3-dehydroquinate dehydratase [Alphaproteobacteria bacterium]